MDYSQMYTPHQLVPSADQDEGYNQEIVYPNDSSMMDAYGSMLYGDEYPQQEFMHIKSVMVDGGDRFHVSSLLFDGQEELLWMGNSGGHITSYYGADLQKYTSFQVHEQLEVRQMLTLDQRIFTLTADGIRCSSKLGRPVYTYRGKSFQNTQCLLQTGPDLVLVGGHQPLMTEFNLETQKEVRQIEGEDASCALLRFSNVYVCAGDTTGKITLRDPQSLRAEHTLQAHTGTLSDFDVHGNQLITCGFLKRMGELAIDRHLMIYDMRYLKAMTPMQMTIDPLFLRFIPTYADRLCVVSQKGEFQVLEQAAITSASTITYQITTHSITAVELSISKQELAFGDSAGYLHLFSSNKEHPVFNPYSAATEFPSVESLQHSISFDDEFTPYSIIPVAYPSNGHMLSDWPEHLCKPVYRKPQPIDPDILGSMKIIQNIGYAPNLSKRKLNLVPYKLTDTTKKEAKTTDSKAKTGDKVKHHIPKMYRKVEIKYTKLGVEDFDFRYYNKTNFAGLETHIPNAYCNAMLQVLYFIEPLRCALLSHLCEREFCLACEMGFLFHMLDQQKGRTCQASNFLRAFRTIPEASALGLVVSDSEEAVVKMNLVRLIQNWNRFILQQMDSELSDQMSQKNTSTETESPRKEPETEEGKETMKDTKSATSKQSVIQSLIGYNIHSKFICKCGDEITKNSVAYVTDLSYPSLSEKDSDIEQELSFCTLLEQSVNMDSSTQTWCTRCDRYQLHEQTKAIESLPDVLSINCHVENSREIDFWQAQEKTVREAFKDKYRQTAPVTDHTPVTKPCRYGALCRRQDCKFKHDNDNDESAEVLSLMEEGIIESSWIPLFMKIKLNPDGKLQAERLSEEEITANDDGAIIYELHATVAYIKDSQTGGNLVSHVKVGDKYHQRKENVTCSQCYMFNDFAISPIEKVSSALCT